MVTVKISYRVSMRDMYIFTVLCEYLYLKYSIEPDMDNQETPWFTIQLMRTSSDHLTIPSSCGRGVDPPTQFA